MPFKVRVRFCRRISSKPNFCLVLTMNADANNYKDLRQQNSDLRARIKILETELEFLRTHPSIMQGIKGETLVASLTGGIITEYAAKHDINLANEATIEVKFSKLNTPVKGAKTRRWNWSKLLGQNDVGKGFDFLLLIGEKDPRYLDQYLDASPYVYFLIPRENIDEILTPGKSIGSQAQINTNLKTARAENSRAIKKYLVTEELVRNIGNTKVN